MNTYIVEIWVHAYTHAPIPKHFLSCWSVGLLFGCSFFLLDFSFGVYDTRPGENK